MKMKKYNLILVMAILTILCANSAKGIVYFKINSDSFCRGSTDNIINIEILNSAKKIRSIRADILFDTECFTVKDVQATPRARCLEQFVYSDITGGIQVAMHSDDDPLTCCITGTIIQIYVDITDECILQDYSWEWGAVELLDASGQEIHATEMDAIITIMDCSGCSVSVSDTTFDFGEYNVGSSRTDTVTFANTGTTVGDIHIMCEGCAKTWTHSKRFILNPGVSRKLAIYCRPEGHGLCQGKIAFSGCGTAEVSVTCSGVYKDSVFISLPDRTVFHQTDENTITLDFENDIQIGTLQSDVIFDTTCFYVTGVRKTDRSCCLDIFQYSEIDGGIRIAITGLGHCILPGKGPIATILFGTNECIEGQYPWTPTNSVSGDCLGSTMFCGEKSGIITVLEVERGDIDGNGVVNIIDAFWGMRIILGELPDPTARELEAADCNDDGEIDITDVIGIVNVILEVGTCPP